MRHIHGPGYPRVIGGGYIAGYPAIGPGTGVYGAVPMAPPLLADAASHAAQMAVHAMHGGAAVVSPPWRPMVAPGTPPVGEGHVALPLNAETFGGQWGNTAGSPAGAASGTQIIFSGRPQKPFKPARLLVRGTKSGATAIGTLIGQIFVGTDLQQGELGNLDLESIGAATAFDTWISFKQAEPGVWIRAQCQLTAYPTGTDFETYVINVLGHYLH